MLLRGGPGVFRENPDEPVRFLVFIAIQCEMPNDTIRNYLADAPTGKGNAHHRPVALHPALTHQISGEYQNPVA